MIDKGHRQLGADNKKRTLAIIVASILVIGGVLGFFWWAHKAFSPFPPEIVSRATFPLYFPEQTPVGLMLDTHSFSSTSQVVTYNYIYEGSKRLIVSIQPLKGVDTDQFNATNKFTTHIGTAYVVDLDSRTTAAVVGQKSLVLINAPQKIAVDTMNQFINNLRQVN